MPKSLVRKHPFCGSKSKLRKRLIAGVWLLFAASLGLSACGPEGANRGFNATSDNFRQITGVTKTVKVDNGSRTVELPYTIDGNEAIFAKIREDYSKTNDINFSKTIKTVSQTLTDDKKTEVQLYPTRIEMIVERF